MSIQKRQLYRIPKMHMDVNIPQIILGESLAIITRETSREDLNGRIYALMELINSLVSDIGSCFPPITQETIEMAYNLKIGDSRIDWTDSIFISQAIVDQDARFVFTKDSKIQTSRVIYDKIKDRDESWSRLSVMDSIPGS